MLEKIINSYGIFWIMGMITAAGILCKCILTWNLKRKIKEAGNMNKSTHRLMKLVKAKFEHACMINDKVENIETFVEKYLIEFKICGLHMHSWSQLQKIMMMVCMIFGGTAMLLSYMAGGMSEIVFRYAAFTGICAVTMQVIYSCTDERYQIDVIAMYMNEYLENTYAPKFRKAQTVQMGEKQEEEQEKEERKEEVREEIKIEEQDGPEEEKVPQEIVLREIIEEFLA